MNFQFINEKEINGIYSTEYKAEDKINILSLIAKLQSTGYDIKSVGIENNSDIGERTLYPNYTINDFTSNYQSITNSEEYVSTVITLDYNNEIVRISVGDNKLFIISYNEFIYLQDILKKNEDYKRLV